MFTSEKSMNERGWIERGELLQLFDRARDYALTLLLAPAGSGKSTLMMQWRRQHADLAPAIVSLGRRDADPVHFFHHLDRAIRAVVPDYSGLSYNDLSAEAALPAEVLAEWLNDGLAGLDAPLYILVDDFQFADNTLIHEVLAELLMQDTGHVHWILASRTYPHFSLSRLKLDDRVLVIDRHDLRFSEDDCHAFGARLCPHLDEQGRRRLWQMTEGWAAGLKLGLMACSQSDTSADQAFGGKQPEMVDYFARVVLHELPPKIKYFLLACSVLERFNASLCDYLLERCDSGVMIDEIHARQLFIQGMEEQPGWWRLHPLFLEFLLGRVQRAEGIDLSALHRRAADWFMQHDDEEMALHHAAQVGEEDYLEALLTLCCERWLRSGNYGAIVHWVLPLPEEQTAAHTGLSGPLIAALTLSRRFNQAQYIIDLVREVPADHLRGRFIHDNNIEFHETMLQLFQHDTDFRVGADREALLSSAVHHDIRAFAMAILAYHYLLHAEFDEALKYAQRAKDTLSQLGYHYLESYADLILVLCDRNRGRMLHAARNVQAMYQRFDDGQQGAAWVNAATAHAVVLYEMNQLDAARQQCETLLPLVSSACATEIIAHAYLTLIRILELEGCHARSQRLLSHLERVLHLGNYDRFHAQVIHEQMRQACRADDPARMDFLMQHCGLLERYRRGEWAVPRHYDEEWERSGLAVALWLQTRGELVDAERVLQSVAQTLRRQGANARAVVAEVNLVLVSWRRDRDQQALQRLQALVSRDGVECLNRTALDEAPGFHNVLLALADRGELELPDMYRQMFAGFVDVPLIKGKGQARSAPVHVEELTAREREILDLLRGGISNREISEACGLAVTTIKWHVKNIFAKLNVSSRAEAIVLANRTPERFGISQSDVRTR